MKISQVIDGDFRVEGTIKATHEWLLKIPVIKSHTPEGKDVSIDVLDKAVRSLCMNHNVKMQWIDLTMLKQANSENELPWYSVSFKKLPEHSWLKTLYGLSIYELYCKMVLYLYAYTRKDE